MISSTKIGVLVGAALALAWVSVGFWAAVLVAVGMVVGALVGRAIGGDLHLHRLLAAFRARRSSS